MIRRFGDFAFKTADSPLLTLGGQTLEHSSLIKGILTQIN